MSTDPISKDSPRVAPRPVEPQRTEAAPAAEKPQPQAQTAPAKESDKFAGQAKPAGWKDFTNPNFSADPAKVFEGIKKSVGGIWDQLTKKVSGGGETGAKGGAGGTAGTGAVGGKAGAKEGAKTGGIETLAGKNATDADKQKLKDMDAFLQQSPTGKAGLDYMKQNKIPVEFANGGGSYWNGTKIVIDRSEDAQTAALTLVHELNHAKASLTGTSGDVNKQTHDGYVNTMVEEESVGTVASIQAKRELVAAGVKVTGSFPLETEYNQAYDAAVAKAKQDNPKISAADAEAIGKKAGLDRVRDGFNNGEVVTSTNGQTYREYYGGYWDSVHKNGNQPSPASPAYLHSPQASQVN